jgi:hypothetical protein
MISFGFALEVGKIRTISLNSAATVQSCIIIANDVIHPDVNLPDTHIILINAEYVYIVA